MLGFIFPMSGSLASFCIGFPFGLMLFFAVFIGYPAFLAATLVLPVMQAKRRIRWIQEKGITLDKYGNPLKVTIIFECCIIMIFSLAVNVGLLWFFLRQGLWKLVILFYALCIPFFIYWINHLRKEQIKDEDTDKTLYLVRNEIF